MGNFWSWDHTWSHHFWKFAENIGNNLCWRYLGKSLDVGKISFYPAVWENLFGNMSEFLKLLSWENLMKFGKILFWKFVFVLWKPCCPCFCWKFWETFPGKYWEFWLGNSHEGPLETRRVEKMFESHISDGPIGFPCDFKSYITVLWRLPLLCHYGRYVLHRFCLISCVWVVCCFHRWDRMSSSFVLCFRGDSPSKRSVSRALH